MECCTTTHWGKEQQAPSAHQGQQDRPARCENGRNATVNREFTREVNKELKEKLQGASVDFDLCSDFTVDEMQQALRSLKSGKSPGPDSIHPEFMMHLGTECQNWLKMFMTNCMQRTKIPKSWRRAKIIAILKAGKSPKEAGSYRPISLLSVCFKLLERLIYNHLLPVVDPQLPRGQAGFLPGRSTVEQVVKLTEDIDTAFENRPDQPGHVPSAMAPRT